MPLLPVLIIFVFGSVIGSFVNVVIGRTVAGEDWVRGRSRCDHCRKTIAWYDNVPLLSYLVLKGKCRHCKKEISIQHPTVELLTGLLFVWWYAMGFAFFQLTQHPLQVIQPLFWLVMGILLLIIVIVDWQYMIIPDFTVVGIGLLALLYRVYLTQAGAMRAQDLWLAILSGVVSMGMFYGIWELTRRKGIGLGDVKYVLVMGWLLGWPRITVGLFLAFTIGAVVGIAMVVARTKTMKAQIAFGPFLVLGTVLSLVWGNNLWAWYLGLLR